MTDPPSFLLDVKDTQSPIPPQLRTLDTTYRLAVLGDKPNAASFDERQPFGGAVAQTLWGILSHCGVPKQSCYANNICPTLQLAPNEDHLATIRADLNSLRPNLVLLLGATALNTFLSGKNKISDWRGSLFTSDSFLPGLKCLSTYHPSDVFIDYSTMPLLRFDLRRAADESTRPEIALPRREFQLEVRPTDAILLLQQLLPGLPLALDIEGGVDGLRCISFTQDPSKGFIVPWDTYTLDEQVEVAPHLAKVLADRHIPKVLQNSLYDNFVLTHIFKMPIRAVCYDTMLSGWEIYPELPKALGVQASIWTREPYYKMGRKADDQRVLWDYCCRDSAVTLEIQQAHAKSLTGPKLDHYRFNVQLLAPLLYMELRGINYDVDSANRQHSETLVKQQSLQQLIDSHVQKACPTHPSLNLNSPKQTCHALYDILSYPTQHPKDGRSVDKSRRTADVDALLNLCKSHPDDAFLSSVLEWRHLDRVRSTLGATPDNDNRIRCGYNVVGTETGRLTCYKTPTGTGANLQTITKKLRHLFRADPRRIFFQCDLAGADGWTVAAHCRRLGDETMWSDYIHGIKPAKVIALMYRHGTIVNTWSRDEIKEKSRAITEEGPEGWLYFACKRVQHGSNYGLGKDRMSLQILKDSYNKLGTAIVVSPQDCLRLQKLYLARYGGVVVWQRWVKEQLTTTGQLSCASGHVRTFFGRRDSHSTYMEALAHEPQANTTYATNLAMLRLWRDSENRNTQPAINQSQVADETSRLTCSENVRSSQSVRNYSLVIEPLHQVHDALCGQFPSDRLDWARDRIKSWFDNPLTIAGQSIIIPFAGQYGPSWGELTNDL